MAAGVAVQVPLAPELTALGHVSVPPAEGDVLVVTAYCLGAVQAEFVPPFDPSQFQEKLAAVVVTAVALPKPQKLAVGAVRLPTPLAVPHTPLTLASNVALTVQSAITAPVV